jgi:hypothetical protein
MIYRSSKLGLKIPDRGKPKASLLDRMRWVLRC